VELLAAAMRHYFLRQRTNLRGDLTIWLHITAILYSRYTNGRRDVVYVMSSVSSAPEAIVGLLIHDVARLLRRRFEQKSREAKLPLSRSQCAALFYVAEEEGMNQAALAQLLDIEPIALVHLIDRLAELGLVERRLNPKDRRAWMLYLTPAAQPVLEQIYHLGSTIREEALSGLPEGRREMLATTLQHLKTNLSRKSPADADKREESLMSLER
jgi:MarR family transcriptional regulator, transcriptional regulator for hemolysin